MQVNINEIKVKIKFIENKSLKAIISLDFGEFVIKGFRVQESSYNNENNQGLWLTPPRLL